jgi:hypothetical protein
LKAAIGRGTLVASKVGRRYYTTLRNAREFFRQCPVAPNPEAGRVTPATVADQYRAVPRRLHRLQARPAPQPVCGLPQRLDRTNKLRAPVRADGAPSDPRHPWNANLNRSHIMRCNIHLASWLKAVNAGNLPMNDVMLTFGDLDLDQVISQGSIKVRFDYPLDGTGVVLEFAGPVTIRKFVSHVAEAYERIYREEAATPGKYAIWGHDPGDLYLEGFAPGKDNVWTLYMGS